MTEVGASVCLLLATALYSYHAIENTANQNTGKPLYTRRYCNHGSHRALH